MTDAERRFTSVLVEARAGADNTMTIGGYAGQFEKLSDNLGGFVEQYTRSFWNKSRGDGWPDVMARYNHSDDRLLGTAPQNLRLSIDSEGLQYEVNLSPDITYQRDLYELVKRGDVKKSSQAFLVFDEEWGTTDTGYPMRSLVSGRLIDVAPVNTPAYRDSSVGLRSANGEPTELGGALLGPQVAYRSLAKKFDADVEEVLRLAKEDALVRFFKRTDNVGPASEADRSSEAALAQALSLK